MSSIDFSEYSELASQGGGFSSKPQIAPEDEFWHSIYISGQQRVNHIGETEFPGKLQIRGVKSNLDKVSIIILHAQNLLVKEVKDGNRDKTECFCFQGEQPWKGTSGRICGKNSTERASVPYCSTCRSQIVVSGILLDDATKQPFLINGKATYVFLRAKGVKYGKVRTYLSDMTNKTDLTPLLGSTPKEQTFEKNHINNKRFVTTITVGKESSKYGLKDVFELRATNELPIETVKIALKKEKETLEQFKEKFDWSRNKTGNTDYNTGSQPPVEDNQKFNFDQPQSVPQQPTQQKSKPVDFSLEDVDF